MPPLSGGAGEWAHAQIEPVVVHELSYALPHYRKGMERRDVGEYLLAVLAWDGIVGNKGLLINAVQRWQHTPGIAFVDAYLAALAAESQGPIYTKNVGELKSQGADVSDPLPG